MRLIWALNCIAFLPSTRVLICPRLLSKQKVRALPAIYEKCDYYYYSMHCNMHAWKARKKQYFLHEKTSFCQANICILCTTMELSLALCFDLLSVPREKRKTNCQSTKSQVDFANYVTVHLFVYLIQYGILATQ